MVINVYKLKSLTPDERSAQMKQTLCTYVPHAQGDDTGAILLFLLDCPPSPLSPLPFVSPPSWFPRVPLGTKCPELAGVGGSSRAQGQRLRLLTCMTST